MRACRAASPASMWGHVGGSAGATNVSSRGEYGEDGWATTASVVLFYWRFSVGRSRYHRALEFQYYRCGIIVPLVRL